MIYPASSLPKSITDWASPVVVTSGLKPLTASDIIQEASKLMGANICAEIDAEFLRHLSAVLYSDVKPVTKYRLTLTGPSAEELADRLAKAYGPPK